MCTNIRDVFANLLLRNRIEIITFVTVIGTNHIDTQSLSPARCGGGNLLVYNNLSINKGALPYWAVRHIRIIIKSDYV